MVVAKRTRVASYREKNPQVKQGKHPMQKVGCRVPTRRRRLSCLLEQVCMHVDSNYEVNIISENMF